MSCARLALAAAFAWALAAGARADSPPPPGLLCLGDSLTFGVGGDGVTWPAVASAQLHLPAINQGFSGWIPRHLMYYALLHDVPCLSWEQLAAIPAREQERRRHQPTIDHERTFIVDGQTVRVCADAAGRGPVAVYRWSASTARWSRSGPGGAAAAPAFSGAVLWMGANGMEADDLLASLRTILQALPIPPGRFLVINLLNRADPAGPAETVRDWAEWTGECNRALDAAYPGHVLHLQEWMTSNSYTTRAWLPAASAAAVQGDLADQQAGLVPRSLRAPGNVTHLNATGYRAVGQLVAGWIAQQGWSNGRP